MLNLSMSREQDKAKAKERATQGSTNLEDTKTILTQLLGSTFKDLKSIKADIASISCMLINRYRLHAANLLFHL